MTLRWLDDRTRSRFLAPTDLDTHPELAILAIVRDTLVVLDAALIAQHPHLVGDDLQSPTEHAASVILRIAASLHAAIDAYCCVLEHEDEHEDRVRD